MKKISLALIGLMMVGSLVGCASESTSTSQFNITTTTDEGTTEYNYSAELNNGELTTSSSVTETPAAENMAYEETADQDDDEDTINYKVEDGSLYVEAPSRDDIWWEVIDYEASVKLAGWSVEDDVYYGRVDANMSQGNGYVVLGKYDDADGYPILYAVIAVDIDDGEIVSVSNTAEVDSLDEYFPVYSTGFAAVDENGQDKFMMAFYDDYDEKYVYLIDGENTKYVPYVACQVELSNPDGSVTDALEVQFSDDKVYFGEKDGNRFIMDDSGEYAVRFVSADEVNAQFA
ncbi:hypothetical protein [Butyrivibrio proteoclasticus]|uniref:hypothetical protein n=1 Tax=Butyrivibrio proteoclasticus TaxID=43305 RepID=UPI00047D7B75|nr:hypothetical protein [Butyrivibrio proteoclasticus]